MLKLKKYYGQSAHLTLEINYIRYTGVSWLLGQHKIQRYHLEG